MGQHAGSRIVTAAALCVLSNVLGACQSTDHESPGSSCSELIDVTVDGRRTAVGECAATVPQEPVAVAATVGSTIRIAAPGGSDVLDHLTVVPEGVLKKVSPTEYRASSQGLAFIVVTGPLCARDSCRAVGITVG